MRPRCQDDAVTIHRLLRHEHAGNVSRAACQCGWLGPWRKNWQSALFDGIGHRDAPAGLPESGGNSLPQNQEGRQ